MLSSSASSFSSLSPLAGEVVALGMVTFGIAVLVQGDGIIWEMASEYSRIK